jgi:hypothetical protein
MKGSTSWGKLGALLALGIAFVPATAAADKTPAAPAAAVGEVRGTVKLSDGKPLPAGWVVFHGPGDRTVRVNIDGGKFLARSVSVGENVSVTIDVEGVRVLAADLRQQLQLAEARAALMKEAKAKDDALPPRIKDLKERLKVAQEMEKQLKGIKVAPKFAARETTPLRVTIRTGTQTIDIRLAE